MPRDRQAQPLGVLLTYFCRKYRDKQINAQRRAEALYAACRQTCPGRTRRRSRLIIEWRIAIADADAAQYMLNTLRQDACDGSAEEMAEWLRERIGRYDWRAAYAKTLVLVDS